MTVALTPAPDLTPTRIIAPAAADAGDQVERLLDRPEPRPRGCRHALERRPATEPGGRGPGSSSWVSSPHHSRFQPGSPTPATSRCRLPSNLQGVFRFSVTTAQGLYESGATGNDTDADPDLLTLSLPLAPDLQVSTVTAPSQANAGGTSRSISRSSTRGPPPRPRPTGPTASISRSRARWTAPPSCWGPSRTSRR